MASKPRQTEPRNMPPRLGSTASGPSSNSPGRGGSDLQLAMGGRKEIAMNATEIARLDWLVEHGVPTERDIAEAIRDLITVGTPLDDIWVNDSNDDWGITTAMTEADARQIREDTEADDLDCREGLDDAADWLSDHYQEEFAVTLRSVERAGIPLDSSFGLDEAEHEDLLDDLSILRVCRVNGQRRLQCYQARLGQDGPEWTDCVRWADEASGARTRTKNFHIQAGIDALQLA